MNTKPVTDDKDLVSVPRSLVGAACSAIDKNRDAPKVLAELRRYTTGDLSQAAPVQAIPEGEKKSIDLFDALDDKLFAMINAEVDVNDIADVLVDLREAVDKLEGERLLSAAPAQPAGVLKSFLTEAAQAGITHLSLDAAPVVPIPVLPFQQRVEPWLLACFGPEISADRIERNHRFFEESTELVQANGMTLSEAHQLVDYTFDRPVGEIYQEAGGVMVTLAALCRASGIDMHAAGETELARIWTKVEAIREKQAAKPKHSPLPAAIEGASKDADRRDAGQAESDIESAMMALLQCSASDLESYSPQMYDGYRSDVCRVIEAIKAKDATP